LENDWIYNRSFYSSYLLTCFFYYSGLKISFFIVVPINFCWNTCSYFLFLCSFCNFFINFVIMFVVIFIFIILYEINTTVSSFSSLSLYVFSLSLNLDISLLKFSSSFFSSRVSPKLKDDLLPFEVYPPVIWSHSIKKLS